MVIHGHGSIRFRARYQLLMNSQCSLPGMLLGILIGALEREGLEREGLARA